MMGIVHSALRRDLIRARVALGADIAPDARQRRAVAAQLIWMMAWLHHHHEGEDAGIYRLTGERNRDAATLLAEMDADHRAIQTGMAALEAAATAYASDPAALKQVVAAIDELETTLLPHLAREEADMMPVVAATITRREWDQLEHELNIAPMGPLELARSGLWVIDGAPPEDRAHVETLVPAVPRWVILHLGMPLYRRLTFRQWRLPEHTARRLPQSASVTVRTPAAPEAVWAVVSDPTRVGQWSHECHEARWLDGARQAALGARFRGRNRSGRWSWSRPCTITDLEPGRTLGWRTASMFGDSTAWRIDVEPDDSLATGGARITEQYRVLSMPLVLDRLIWQIMPSHHDRRAALRNDLERLAELAQQTQSSTPLTG